MKVKIKKNKKTIKKIKKKDAIGCIMGNVGSSGFGTLHILWTKNQTICIFCCFDFDHSFQNSVSCECQFNGSALLNCWRSLLMVNRKDRLTTAGIIL